MVHHHLPHLGDEDKSARGGIPRTIRTLEVVLGSLRLKLQEYPHRRMTMEDFPHRRRLLLPRCCWRKSSKKRMRNHHHLMSLKFLHPPGRHHR